MEKLFPKPKLTDKDKLFCCIESSDNENIELYISEFGEQIFKILAQNSWNILMYSCRYGNEWLLSKLWPEKEKFDNCSVQTGYTYVHAACFGNDLQILRLLVDEKSEDVNPYSIQISENTPLRFACKAGYKKIIEFLVKRGAFFYDESRNFCNNCQKNTDESKGIPFKTLDGKEILPNFVVRLENDRIDPEIKEFIRAVQIKSFVVFKNLAKKREINENLVSKKLKKELAKFKNELYLKRVQEFIVGQ